MNAEQKSLLETLAEDESFKRQIYDTIGRQNCANLTQKERVKLDVSYRIAEVEWFAARYQYQTKLNTITKAGA